MRRCPSGTRIPSPARGLVTLWFKEPNYRGGVGRRRLDLVLVGAFRRPARGDFCPDLPFSADGGACLPEVLAGRSGLPGTAGPVARGTAGEGRPKVTQTTRGRSAAYGIVAHAARP